MEEKKNNIKMAKKKSSSSNNRPHKNGKKPFVDTVKVFSLGGLGVVGMNMYVVEVNNEIMIMDAGILFAGGDEHGVSYIVPDFSYLKENEKRIVGLFITHGHEDHIGGLPFLLKEVNIPCIYAAGIAVGLIKNKMEEFPSIKYKLERFDDNSIYKYRHFELSFFRTNHSIPDSFGIAIKTKHGYIVNTGDFKFDYTPIGCRADYFKMAKLGEEGVLCLLADSTNAMISSPSLSEKRIGIALSEQFSQIKGRIIVATFASNVYRVQQIIEASINTGRKIVVFGHSMEKTIEVATREGYITIPKGLIITSRDYNKQTNLGDKVTILCTGSQGEPMAALSKIASGTHKQIHLMKDDTIIFSSKPIPGNEQYINRNINKLVKSGAKVIRNTVISDTHTTGHASQEEIKLLFSLIKPKYFMPVHGEYAMLKSHIGIAMEMGTPKENCFALNTGDVLQFKNGIPSVIKNGVFASDIYIDDTLSDVDSTTLKDRKSLAGEGFVSVTFTFNRRKEIVAQTKLITKGFADESNKNNIDLFNKIIFKAEEIFSNVLSHQQKINIQVIRNTITSELSKYIKDICDKKPVVLPIINYIE